MKALALWAGVGCSLFSLLGEAQELRLPISMQQDTYAYKYYYQEAQPSPSDLPVEAPPLDIGGEFAKELGGKDFGKGGKGSSARSPRRVFPTIGNGWTVEGWIAGGGTANSDNPTSNYNGPMTFNDRADELMLNQLYLSIGRDADNGGCGWAWGGRVDMLYGQDYIFTQAVGLETNTNGTPKWNSSKMFGVALPQFYGEIAYNDLSVKVGHFYTIMGYEVVQATGNFFYSHAYTMQYGEPFTHTGALATYNYNDRWTLYGGAVNGWDNFDAVTDKVAFLGGATYSPDHGRYSLTGTIISGDEAGAAPPTSTRTGYSVVLDYDISSRLKYVLQHDNFWQDNDPANGGMDSEWYGINQYFFYTINDCWKVGARMEWFRDDDGVRLSGSPVRESFTGGVPAGSFNTPAESAGNYYNITVGANWTPNSNLTVRPEVRWDWSDGTGGGPGMGLPYDSRTKDSQFTAGLDAIIVF